MPKIAKGTALKKIRKQLKIAIKSSEISETEDSAESDSSGDLSHIPLKDKNQIPEISDLSINETTEMEQTLQQMMEQLRSINQSITNLTQRQETQERTLQELRQAQNEPQNNIQANEQIENIRVEDFYRIPDPIKSLPPYDGNRKQLQAWLSTAEDTLRFFHGKVSDQLFKMYVTAVVNKIQGKAKDILCLAGNPQEFESIKNVLTTALGDRQELSTYKCQLWQHKMTEGMSIHRYYQKSKELIQNIKTLAKQNSTYKDNWAAINLFIDEDGLAAFISGLKGTYFGHVQAARPKDVEDAYAFLCKFKSQEIAANSISEKSSKPNQKNENPQKTDQRSYQKPQFQNQSQNEKPKNQATPMDIDPSLKSRLTLNKKLINNTELEPLNDDSSEEEEELIEGNTNFCMTDPEANTT